MKQKDPRRLAFEILLSLEKGKSNSAILLQRALHDVPQQRDRNFITDLVLGTLRWRGRIRYAVDRYSSRSSDALDLRVAAILQLGIYQLAFTRIPPHAAVHATVSLCRSAGVTSAGSLVNAILRRVQRSLPDLPEPEGGEGRNAVLSVRWSHPAWLVDRWIARFGEEEAIALMKINNTPPRVYLRVNDLNFQRETVLEHLQAEGIQIESTEFGENVLAVASGAPQNTESFRNGEFYIQDAAIQMLGEMIHARPEMRILEIAAAPGGKTVHMAAQMLDQGRIISVDSDLRRMQLWQTNIRRLRIHSALPVVADARNLPLTGQFSKVVIDAPCSSLGVVRRHPEVKWWRKPDDLSHIQSSQLKILNACAKYVPSQGELIYSVCSFEPEETSEVVDRFLSTQTDFVAQEARYLFPHRHNTDGFFVAKFSRQ